jgi:hypothetical protein
VLALLAATAATPLAATLDARDHPGFGLALLAGVTIALAELTIPPVRSRVACSAGPLGAENAVTSSDVQILVHETAKSVASQRPGCSARAWGGRAGRRLAFASFRRGKNLPITTDNP